MMGTYRIVAAVLTFFCWNYLEFCKAFRTENGVIDKTTDSWMDKFSRLSTVVCRPQVTKIQCPHRMHIRPTEVTQIINWSDSSAPTSMNCRWSEREIAEYAHAIQRIGTKSCLNSNAKARVRHSCEGRNVCELDSDPLQDNRTECQDLNLPIRVEYQCLPDPDIVLFEAICADTYMDVRCDGHGAAVSVASLVILTARLERRIDTIPNKPIAAISTSCPVVHHPVEKSDSKCLDRIDVTQDLQSSCNGRTSCSINPNAFGKTSGPCGKMHLALNYVCVPGELVAVTKIEMEPTEDKKRLKLQRQLKALSNNKGGQGPTPHSSLPNDASTRGTRQLPNAIAVPKPQDGMLSVTETMTNRVHPFISDQILSNGMIQPLLIGVGIGLALLAIVFGLILMICRKRKRNTFTKDRSIRDSCQPIFAHDYGNQAKPFDVRTAYPTCNCDRTQSHNPTIIPSNGGHVEKCCCGEVSLHALSGSVPDNFTQYQQHGNTGETVPIRTPIVEFEAPPSYGSDISPRPQFSEHHRTILEGSINTSPEGYQSAFGPMSSSNRIDSSGYSAALRASSILDTCSGRGCDGGSGASDPCEVPHYGYKPYVPLSYTGAFSRSVNGVQEPCFSDHPSLSPQDIYPKSPEVMQYMPHKQSGLYVDYDLSTLGARSHHSGTNNQGSDRSARSIFANSNYHGAYSPDNYIQTDTVRLDPTISRVNDFRNRGKLFQPLGDSLESLTEPLLEPPKDFQTVYHQDTRSKGGKETSFIDNNKSKDSYINSPPDLILNDGTYLSQNREFLEESEVPLPPPPLKVFGPDGYPPYRTIHKRTEPLKFPQI